MHLLKNKYYQILIVFAIFATLIISKNALPQWLFRAPSFLILPLNDWLNSFFLFLQEDLGFIHITRAISASVSWILGIVSNILLGTREGFKLPALPWTAVLAIVTIIAYALMGWKMALLTGISVVYIALFGQWKEAMQTLSLVLVTVPLSVFFGLLLGVLAYKKKIIKQILDPFLNVAQSLPHFSYLIPVVVFFGIGHHAGVIATIIFATPPMIRLTILGLSRVSPEIIESGKMSGCNNLQLLTKVLIPSAKQDIMIGVNQVIMQCLAMVVIASFIGAPGLGYKLLLMLNSLRIGKALELGVSIVLVAVILDRLSLAWAYKQPNYTENLPFYLRYKYPLIILSLVAVSILVSLYYPYAYKIPRKLAFTTEGFWDAIVDYIVVNWFDSLLNFRSFLLLEVLIPLRDFYLSLPTFAVLILVGGIGYVLGGITSAIIVLLFALFIVISGWWDKSMITLYMLSFSVFICIIIGLPLGILASRTLKLRKFKKISFNALRQLSNFSFIYLSHTGYYVIPSQRCFSNFCCNYLCNYPNY